MKTIAVIAFVDWTAQIYNSGANAIKDPFQRAQVTLDKISLAIALTLNQAEPKARFTVQFRLYHGWHRALTPTNNRMALRMLENDPEFRFRSFQNVRFELPLGYGETLLSALPSRLTKNRPQIHLPDTLRPSLKKQSEEREKMVDTSLVCDLLTHARSDPADWRLIAAEDDDMVPALFVSEAWTKEKGGKTLLIRRRSDSKYLSLDGLIKEYLA